MSSELPTCFNQGTRNDKAYGCGSRLKNSITLLAIESVY